MKDPYGLSQASIPVAYAQLLLEILIERGFSIEQVLKKSKLSGSLFLANDARITPRQWTRLVLTGLSLTNDDGLGYEYGLRLSVTVHGMLGFAIMSASTLGQALLLGVAYFSMRLRDYRISLHTEDKIAVLEITETHPISGTAPEQATMLRRFFHECVMVGIFHVEHSLTGQDCSEIEICVDWPEPSYHVCYRSRLPHMRFNQTSNQLHCPVAYLARPLLMANPFAYQQALAQCEVERLRFANAIDDIVVRVRAELILTPGKGYPNVVTVANRLNVSERTLKRRLQQFNLSYLQLLEQTLQQEAKNLLTSEMDIQDIANMLGYIAPANFTRAFKKWTGETPSQYRQSLIDT